MQVQVCVEGGEGVWWVAVVCVAKGRRRRTRGRKQRKRGRTKEGEERGVSERVQVVEKGRKGGPGVERGGGVQRMEKVL